MPLKAHRAILRGVVLVGLFAVVGKVAGAAKEMAVAWRFGVGSEVDAYVLVLSLANWPVVIWASMLGVILLPMAARLRRESPERLREFRAELLGATLVAGAILALVLLVALPPLLSSRWLGLPASSAALAARYIPVLGWLVLPGMLAGLAAAWVMTSGRHLNTLLEGIPALGILIGVMLWPGIMPLVWATLLATVVHVAVLAATQRAEVGWELPRFTRLSPYWGEFGRALGVVVVGQVIMGCNPLVDQFFAAGLGEGAISSLGFANRLLSLALGLVATALTRATLPVFAEAEAAGKQGARRMALRWSGMMALVGAAVALAAWWLAPWGVAVVFERGTFTAADTEVVTRLLRFGVWQLPFYFASLVLVSLHSSRGRYHLLMVSGAVGLSAKAIASYLLIPHFGVGALMLSQALVYASTTVLLLRADSR